MKLLTKANAIYDRLLNLMAFLAIGLLVFVWSSVNAEVVMRYFVGQPLHGVVELSEYSLVFITFLAAAWLLKREGHVVMDIVVKQFSLKNQALVLSITSILSGLACLVLFWYGTDVFWDYFQRGIHDDMKVLKLPFAPLLAIIPIGTFLLFIQFLKRGYRYLLTCIKSNSQETSKNHL